MSDVDNQSEDALTELEQCESILGSVLFWIAFLVASAMYGAFVVSPSVIEYAQLRQQQARLENEISSTNAEIRYFEQVATALETDADFRNRVAVNELVSLPASVQQIAVSEDLGFQVGVPREKISEAKVSRIVGEEFFESLSENPLFRQRWGIATAMIFFVAFALLNNAFLSGAIGRGLISTFLNVVRRYQLPS